MVWTHKSIERAPSHTVTLTRVLKGATVIAWLRPALGNKFDVTATSGDYIGTADSPAHAMLMAKRHDETKREVRR